MTNGSMTKAELVEEVSRVSDLTKKHSEIIVDTVFKSIIDALHRGEKIELRGFGSFRLRRREPRKGRNPKTGDKVDVPPKKVPVLQARQGTEGPDQPRTRGDARAARPARFPRARTSRASRTVIRIRRSNSVLERLWTPWRLAYVSGGGESPGCVFCAAPDDGNAAPLVVFRGAHLFRHPQSLPLQQRPPDGRAAAARRDAGRHVARRACRAIELTRRRRDRAHRSVRATRHEHGDQPR